MSIRKYTTLQLSLEEAKQLCYRDVIRVERVNEYDPIYDDIPDHDTLVVLKNGKLLHVYSWKDKNRPLIQYNTLFEYLNKLMVDKETYFNVTLNQFCHDPNILHRKVESLWPKPPSNAGLARMHSLNYLNLLRPRF